MIIDIKLSFR